MGQNTQPLPQITRTVPRTVEVQGDSRQKPQPPLLVIELPPLGVVGSEIREDFGVPLAPRAVAHHQPSSPVSTQHRPLSQSITDRSILQKSKTSTPKVSERCTAKPCGARTFRKLLAFLGAWVLVVSVQPTRAADAALERTRKQVRMRQKPQPLLLVIELPLLGSWEGKSAKI